MTLQVVKVELYIHVHTQRQALLFQQLAEPGSAEKEMDQGGGQK